MVGIDPKALKPYLEKYVKQKKLIKSKNKYKLLKPLK
jgi:hypothetical protein